MEATAEALKTSNAGAIKCKVCLHPDREAIHNAIVIDGASVLTVALKYAGQFSRHTLHRHLADCVRSTSQTRKADLQYDSALDINNRLSALLSEGEDALVAAKSVLLVDGDLCFDPRAWEINVVYKDWHDIGEGGEPKLKTAKLSKLLAMIQEGGKEPQHSYIKAEDMRKTFRDCIGMLGDIIDRIAKFTGAYKRVDNQQEQLDLIKANIMKAAHKFDTSYEHELGVFLADHAQNIRPDLKGELEKEYRGMAQLRSPVSFGPLPAAGGEVKALPASPDLLPEPLGIEESPNNSGKLFLGTIEVEN